MRVAFTPPTTREFDILFLRRRGGGFDDINTFIPPGTRRGRRGGGIFNILSGLAKKAIPFLMRNVIPEAIHMGRGVVSDVMEGRNVKQSLKTRGIGALQGLGNRFAKGGGRARVKKKKIKNRQLKKKKAKKCYKTDIFSQIGLV